MYIAIYLILQVFAHQANSTGSVWHSCWKIAGLLICAGHSRCDTRKWSGNFPPPVRSNLLVKPWIAGTFFSQYLQLLAWGYNVIVLICFLAPGFLSTEQLKGLIDYGNDILRHFVAGAFREDGNRTAFEPNVLEGCSINDHAMLQCLLVCLSLNAFFTLWSGGRMLSCSSKKKDKEISSVLEESYACAQIAPFVFRAVDCSGLQQLCRRKSLSLVWQLVSVPICDN